MDPLGKILLVEDHTGSASALSRLLRLSGYEVFLAHDVRTAKNAADAQHFDLAVCDIELPDGDGRDLMKQLHQDHYLDGIALTGHAFEKEEEQIGGFVRCFIKPVLFEKLKEAIDDCVIAQNAATRPSVANDSSGLLNLPV